MAQAKQARPPNGRNGQLAKPVVLRLLPFLPWFDGYNFPRLRADFIAGLTVALVLVPQSMAYAQLAGLPAFYGLYAAFLPPMVAAFFGSSYQLATGPVAVVSLMTATALEPLATAGSPEFVAYAVMLALIVGAFQFLLGVFKLGMVVNFLSHPVVNGFTNAAALIIATSQLSKIFGVYVDKAEHHYETVYNVCRAALHYSHWPTMTLAALAFAIMIVLKRVNRKIPSVLVAVVVTTAISFFLGFENDQRALLSQLHDPAAGHHVRGFNLCLAGINEASARRERLKPRIQEAEESHGEHSADTMELYHELSLLDLKIAENKERAGEHRARLRELRFARAPDAATTTSFYLRGQLPPGRNGDGRVWRLKVGNKPLNERKLIMQGGGAVVGNIPGGLPKIGLPKIDLSAVLGLLTMAVTISLLGFMEAISIAKAMAAKTGQRLDPNQELIGQGLANMAGSLGQSYPVSGSFSRSAVNLQAGAVTGLSSVFSSAFVILTLLFFTKWLYHLPQAVLAAIIMMAVIGLINIKSFIHSWQAQKYDGAISIISFISTLAFAPHLDRGIMIGVALSLGLYMFRNIKPSIALLSKHPDGTYRNADRFALQKCERISVVRFQGSLFFANVSFLEESVLEQIATRSELKHILLVGNGINELDASGEETLSRLTDRLRGAGYEFSITGLNDAVLDVMHRTHLYEKIGEENLFRNVTLAIAAIHEAAHRGGNEQNCPLLEVCYADEQLGQLQAEAFEGESHLDD